MNTKKCSVCKQEMSILKFGKDARAVDGFKCLCKICNVKKSTVSRLKLKDPTQMYSIQAGPAVPENQKYCISCKIIKLKKAFSIERRNKDGRRTYCKSCTAQKYFRGQLVNEVEFQEMMNQQKGVCAICGIDFGDLPKRACVDHDHKTNKVRGLLCTYCNSGLGHFKDSVKFLQRARHYLLVTPASKMDKRKTTGGTNNVKPTVNG